MLGPVGTGDARTRVWEERSDAVFRELSSDPASGIRLVRGRLLAAPELGSGLPPWAASVPGYVGPLGTDRLPEGFLSGFEAELPFADMPAYLAWLLLRVRDLGGSVEQRLVSDLAECAPASAAVVNCSGLGAAGLARDPSVQPVWGQHVIVEAPEVEEFCFEGGGSGDGISVMPQRRGVILGGVRRPGRNALVPDAQVAEETIARAAQAVPALAHAPVLGIEVGLRPSRPTVRLEREQVGSTTVVHNYGHDGNGVFWSWGGATEVVQLILDPPVPD